MHVCTNMKIIMHNANRSQNICSTSKYYHTKFQIIPFSRLATLGLQMYFGGLCTYARIWKSPCTMQIDGKTFAVLQSIIILNFISFRPLDKQYFANSFWWLRPTDRQTNRPTDRSSYRTFGEFLSARQKHWKNLKDWRFWLTTWKPWLRQYIEY